MNETEIPDQPALGRMTKLMPAIIIGLLAIATLAFFCPQHQLQQTKIALCLAPDCKSSSWSSTEVCGGLERLKEEPFPDLVIPIVFVMLLVLQVLVIKRRTRRLHMVAGISTIQCAVIAGLLMAWHNAIGHLFATTETLWGEALLIVTLVLMVPAGLVQLRTAPSRTEQKSS